MRQQQRMSREQSRQDINRRNRENDDNEFVEDDEEDDSVNCPMIFKTFIVALITCGIIAFLISFGVEIVDSQNLDYWDFTNCGDHPNRNRLTKAYAYQKIILGLLISAVVIALGLTVFMIRLSYYYCQCFGECYREDSQQSSEVSQNIDLNKYQIDLKKRITANILLPKQYQENGSYQQNQKNKKQQTKNQRQLKNQQLKIQKKKKFKKSKQEIQKFNENYSKYVKNSQSNECDCQCDDCGSCVAYCLGCLWCKSCYDAHHYHFYNSKKEEYTYWIGYMIKTFLFGFALAYVIRLYVSLQETEYCGNENTKIYLSNLQVPMIIGIVTAVIDAFGYIHLFVEGTLLQIVEDTLHSESKSQHSDSQSDRESAKDNQVKKLKKYQQSEQSYSFNKKKSQKPQKKSTLKRDQEIKEPIQNSTKDNLIKSLKNKNKQQQTGPKDTDTFFITLKTLGNRYLDNIEDQNDQNEKKISSKKKKQVQSSQNQKDSNKKPRIEVPQSIQKLPQKSYMKMERQQTEKQQSEHRKSIEIEKLKNQYEKQEVQNVNKPTKNYYEYQKPKPYGKFGAFNKDKSQLNADKDKKQSQFLKLSKYSTNF